ncbi:hypothetical protein KRR55_06055 [Paeniglutamicibacter sp. ABSL32-1]|uniref:hypothetical protein n=1 Tax=Paeniglutamicibacter quisquiliarum TaxID=2849498 RepID=UPI001C2D76A4|nr:hypothetical protein [Paeniglutamicibacter quisquiliarum]MBV1778675.1 hypothetical protein [Paeniglutamicibacter quisquiliarum]
MAMGRFKLVKTISLNGISDGWGDDTFVRFNVLTTEESESFAKKLRPHAEDEVKVTEIFREALKSAFIDGKVQLQDELADAEADDIDDLPKGVVIEAWNNINGNVYSNPNA